jgi:hypothetical protein
MTAARVTNRPLIPNITTPPDSPTRPSEASTSVARPHRSQTEIQPLPARRQAGASTSAGQPQAASSSGQSAVAQLPQRVPGDELQAQIPSRATTASQAREAVQNKLAAFKDVSDERRGASNEQISTAANEAHAAVVSYGKASGQLLDRLMPVAHQTTTVGVAGTAMAFGVGRNTGMAIADEMVRAMAGKPAELGVTASAAAVKPPATWGAAELQWVSGALTGAVGNLVGQTVVKPAVDALSGRQHKPIDPQVLVPPQMVQMMNDIHPGSGDALRNQVQAQQGDISKITSNFNVRLGQAAFDVASGARAAIQGNQATGMAGTVGVGLAVSFAAGSAIGLGMGVRAATGQHKVPDMAALTEKHTEVTQQRAASQNVDGAAALKDVPKNTVPLFYTHHTALKNPLTAIKQAWQDNKLRQPPSVDNPDAQHRPSTWAERGALVLKESKNLAVSVGNRAFEMAKATVPTAVAAGVASHAGGIANEAASRITRAVCAGVGIHMAIQPWFNSLATAIPDGDKKVRAQRLAELQPPVQPPPQGHNAV